jgi:hypothetical protein
VQIVAEPVKVHLKHSHCVSLKIVPCNIAFYYMAFQNSLFWLVDKRSVKTHIRTVVRIFRIWTGVPDVVYLAGNFCFANRKNFCFLIFQLCFICKTKSICSQTQFSHIINRLLTSLVRSVLWNIRPLFFAWTSLLRRSVHTKKPRSDISQYRPHARSISRYNLTCEIIYDNLTCENYRFSIIAFL